MKFIMRTFQRLHRANGFRLRNLGHKRDLRFPLTSQRLSARWKSSTPADYEYHMIVMGAPGVGKGTYSKRFAPHFNNAEVMTSGDLVRELIKANADTEEGKYLAECVKTGALVEDNIILALAYDFLRTKGSFILDGFPRTLAQSKSIYQEYRIDVVVNFTLPDEILLEKALGRRMCPDCGAGFNIADINYGEIVMPSMAPKVDGVCDECQGRLVIREDDVAEVILNRLAIHHEASKDILEFFSQHKLLLEYPVKKGLDDLPDIIQKIDEFVSRNH